MWFLLQYVLCKEKAPDAGAEGTAFNMMYLALPLAFDVALLLYLIVTRKEEGEFRNTYIFLAHGTAFYFLSFLVNYHWPIALALCLLIVVGMYFLCAIPLAVTIIAALNISGLFAVVYMSLLYPVMGDKAAGVAGLSGGLILGIVVAVFFRGLLLKVHNLFVVYVYSAYLVTCLGIMSLIGVGGTEKIVNPLTYISALVLFGVLAILVFMS